jgi:hypothetical protein
MSSLGDAYRKSREKRLSSMQEKRQKLTKSLSNGKAGDFAKAGAGLLGVGIGLIGVTAALSVLNN